MLTRSNYYQDKKNEIEHVVFTMMDDLLAMMGHCLDFLDAPTEEKRSFLLETEDDVDHGEREIEAYILDLISIQQLDVKEIKWLFMMNRIIRDLERVGDQITNVMTICNTSSEGDVKSLAERFFVHEKQMIYWLKSGIDSRQTEPLASIRDRDGQVNQLNRDTYDRLIALMNEQKMEVEIGSKMIIVSRFLERVGDHLVNAAELLEKYVQTELGSEENM